MSIIVHANWRGVYEVAHYSDGTVVKNGYSLGQMPLPGQNVNIYLQTFRPQEVPSWFGSLVTNQKDASGLLYRRNRYYEPGTGRFTQEDPIGLAGGLNLYGFGGGDPVNYADPFGLKGCNQEKRTNCKEETQLGKANQAGKQIMRLNGGPLSVPIPAGSVRNFPGGIRATAVTNVVLRIEPDADGNTRVVLNPTNGYLKLEGPQDNWALQTSEMQVNLGTGEFSASGRPWYNGIPLPGTSTVTGNAESGRVSVSHCLLGSCYKFSPGEQRAPGTASGYTWSRFHD